MVSDLRRELAREVNTQGNKESNMASIVVPSETNSKVSEFQISVSKRKLNHETTQQQNSKRQVIENAPLTEKQTLIIYTCCCCCCCYCY